MSKEEFDMDTFLEGVLETGVTGEAEEYRDGWSDGAAGKADPVGVTGVHALAFIAGRQARRMALLKAFAEQGYRQDVINGPTFEKVATEEQG